MVSRVLLSACFMLAVSQAVPRGRRDSLKIYHGKNVSNSDYPYMVSITSAGVYDSVGVILNKHWILTAAMNIAACGDKTIRVGSNYWDKGGEVYKVERGVVYKDWDIGWDNVGLLRTWAPIKFGENVKSIKLAEDELKVGQTGVVTGWGCINTSFKQSKKLLMVNSTLVDLKVCQNFYHDPTPTTNQFCTFDKRSGPDDEDDGIPMVVNGVLYGMFAGNYHGASNARPSVWTHVAKYKTWIWEHSILPE